jgi:hypothetical protein
MGRGRFGGIGSAPPSGGGNYLGVGIHRLKIKKLTSRESQRPQNKGDVMAIVEFEVIESSNETHTPGSSRSWVVNMKHGVTALGNLKSFLQAAAQLPDSVVNDESFDDLSDEMFGPLNPLMGFTVVAEGFLIETVAKKQPFTKFNWESDPEQAAFDLDVFIGQVEAAAAQQAG